MDTLDDVIYDLISESVMTVLSEYELNEDTTQEITDDIYQKISSQLELMKSQVELMKLRSKLTILFEYEKNYLTLLKDFKEEIKFANALQEDLRKERAKFFSEILREVSSTLTEAQVEETVASNWIQDLVKSYTNSLDLSNNLIDENTLDTIGKIRSNAKADITNISLNNDK